MPATKTKERTMGKVTESFTATSTRTKKKAPPRVGDANFNVRMESNPATATQTSKEEKTMTNNTETNNTETNNTETGKNSKFVRWGISARKVASRWQTKHASVAKWSASDERDALLKAIENAQYAAEGVARILEALPDGFTTKAKSTGRSSGSKLTVEVGTRLVVREKHLASFGGALEADTILEVVNFPGQDKPMMGNGQVALKHPSGAIVFIHRKKLELAAAEGSEAVA